jgi:large subunit ribosomal protein L21
VFAQVTEEDIVISERLAEAEVGSTFVLDEVLLVGTLNQTIIGRPTIAGATVLATVEEQSREAKVTIFKKKQRSTYRRTKGHRQYHTILRISSLELPDSALSEASA